MRDILSVAFLNLRATHGSPLIELEHGPLWAISCLQAPIWLTPQNEVIKKKKKKKSVFFKPGKNGQIHSTHLLEGIWNLPDIPT